MSYHIFFILAGCCAVLALLVGAGVRAPAVLPYEKRGRLVSAAERSFLGALDAAVGPGTRVFSKVRVGDILDVTHGLTGSRRTVALNRITSKHVDFVLCDAADLTILCALELNDRSHQRRDRSARDQFLESAFAAADVPLLFFTARSAYSVADIRARLSEAVKGRQGERVESRT